MTISRRDILRSLTITAVTGSVLRVIPLEAAEYVHRLVRRKSPARTTRVHARILFRTRLQDPAQPLQLHHSSG